MPRTGENLPEFRARQLDFAAHLRNPDLYPCPEGLDARRMRIYVDLVYNNVESFLANGFPVAKEILGDASWHALIRDFLHRHPSESPYFLEIPQEFLAFVSSCDRSELPDYFLELCHYEWVELALATAEDDLPEAGVDPSGDVVHGRPVVSPLIWPLAYRYPVHRIGPGFRPDAPPESPTHLIVFRRRDDSVGFLEASAATLRLVELLSEGVTGTSAIERLCREMPGLDSQVVHDEGVATMMRLREAGIILGTEIAGASE
jgi:hypothetical protein